MGNFVFKLGDYNSRHARGDCERRDSRLGMPRGQEGAPIDQPAVIMHKEQMRAAPYFPVTIDHVHIAEIQLMNFLVDLFPRARHVYALGPEERAYQSVRAYL